MGNDAVPDLSKDSRLTSVPQKSIPSAEVIHYCMLGTVCLTILYTPVKSYVVKWP